MKPSHLLLTLSCGILPAASACAQFVVTASAGVAQTELKEYDIGGRELVREHGGVPGVEARAEYGWHDWRFGIDGSTFRRTVTYDGRLQNGMPFASDTDITQDRLGIDATYRLNDTAALIGGIEWEHRGRRIFGSASAGGLDERSTSWRLLAGGTMRLVQLSAATIDAKALAIFADAERLDIRFDQRAFDDVSFSTKPAVGLRTAFTITPMSLPRLSAVFEFDWMHVRRSDDAVLRRNDIVAGTVTQPAHRRRTLTAYLSYRFD